MDFGKAKSVLIVLFLFVNLFLIYHLFSLSDDSIRIDRTSIDDTITLLNQRGITIDKELIPTRLDHMDYLELSNPLIDADQFASTLVKSTQKNGDTYVGEGGNLIISDGTFLWEPSDHGQNLGDNLTSRKTSNKVLDYLRKNNFPTNFLKWDNTTDLGNGTYEVHFHQHYMEQEFFHVNLTVLVYEEGILSVRGKYFEIDSVKNTGTALKSPLSILLEFSTSVSANQDATIIDLTSGYYTDTSSQNYKHLPAVPCWKITLKSGETFYYDGITSKYIPIS